MEKLLLKLRHFTRTENINTNTKLHFGKRQKVTIQRAKILKTKSRIKKLKKLVCTSKKNLYNTNSIKNSIKIQTIQIT